MTRMAATLLMLTLIAGPAAAQQPTTPANARSSANVAGGESSATTPELRQAVKAIRFEIAAGDRDAAPAPRRTPEMSGAKRGVLTALAGVGGFFAGGYLGAAIEGDRCNCDDPGLMGALIGMPIGAATAAIVTWFATGRD